MLHRSRAIAIAGALCVLAALSCRGAWADTTDDAIRHVNAVVAVPEQAAAAPDPCAARGWSLSHPLRFCGRVRLVPADTTERKLWWADRLAELADAYFSALGQQSLFATHQVVVSDAARGRAWTLAQLQGYASPARAEANPFVRPFAGGGVGGYLLGFATIDLGQSLLAGAPPALGLRGLDELSRRSLLSEDLGEHIQGAQSWTPVLDEARNATATTQVCTALAERILHDVVASGTLDTAKPPERCAGIWPSIKAP